MDIDHYASQMGDKNPIMLQRRGTLTGYAFSEDVIREEGGSEEVSQHPEHEGQSHSSTPRRVVDGAGAASLPGQDSRLL